MSSTIVLNIAKAIPHGNSQDSAAIVALWRTIAAQLGTSKFSAQSSDKAVVKSYEVSMDASALLAVMEKAVSSAGSFDGYREAHGNDASVSLAGSLKFSIAAGGVVLEGMEAYAVATIFLQQLVLASNLVLPGSFQMLGASFSGSGSHLVEAGVADSVIFGGVRNSQKEGWPRQPALEFAHVWQWLEQTEVSQTHTALKGINKVLLTMLKVAEQRHEYSARTVLLVLFQLEILLDTHTRHDAVLLRKRLRMVLGNIPERADCIKELSGVRNELFVGTQPVHRPPLLTHTVRDELAEQLGQYNMVVINGSAMVFALLRELINRKARTFVFTESVGVE